MPPRLTTEAIVCTYNGSKYVVEQLQSLLLQSVSLDRITIQDDQSSDDTLVKIESYLEQLPTEQKNLVTIHVNPANLGYAKNFCEAILKASADILFLCDQDDVWESNKVECILDLFEKYQPDMVFSDGRLVGGAGQIIHPFSVLEAHGLTNKQVVNFRQNSFKHLLKKNYINGAASAIKREAAWQALPLPGDMPHDYWLALWSSTHKGVVATPEKLYRYRQHENNVIGAGVSNFVYEMLGAWRHPNWPRERELAIWSAVTSRICGTGNTEAANLARQKLAWLARVVTKEKKSVARGFAILKSLLNGSYRNYSTCIAFLRDAFSLIN